MRSVIRLTIALLVVCLGASAFAATNEPLAVTVDAKDVTISNVTPGGSVVLFFCSRVPRPRSVAVQPQGLLLTDDDHDGVIHYTPAEAIPLRSVFVAVDEATGQYATGAPRGFPFMVAPFAADVFRKDAEDLIASLAVDKPRLVLLLVRPGTGAWRLTSWDGGPHDHDGKSDGRQQLNFEDAVSFDGKEKAPKHLKAGDVVVMIATGHLDVFISAIGK